MSIRPRHLLLVIAINLAWAMNFIAGKWGVEHFPPILFTALRFSLVSLLVLPFLRPVSRRRLPTLLTVCLVMGVIHYGLMYTAMKVSDDVSSIAIGSQMYIPFAATLAAIFLRERIDSWKVGGIVLAACGIIIINFDPAILANPAGLALSLAAALAMAVANQFIPSLRSIGLLNMQGWLAIASMFGLGTFSALFETSQWQAVATASMSDWLTVVYAAFGATLIGHGLFYFLLQRYPVSDIVPYMNLTPPFAIALGMVMLGDRPGTAVYLGGFFTIMGVLLVTISDRRRASLPAQTHADT